MSNRSFYPTCLSTLGAMSRLVWPVLPFVLWNLLWLAVSLHIAVYAFPTVLDGTHVGFVSATEVLGMLRRNTGFPIPDSVIVVITFAAFFLLLLSTGIRVAIGWLIDRLAMRKLYEQAYQSITWGIKNFFASGIVFLVFLPAASAVIPLQGMGYATGFAFLVILLAAPIVVLGLSVLESKDFVEWFRIRCPGWQPLSLFYSGFAVIEGIRMAIDSLPHPFSAVLGIAWYPIDAVVFGVLLS